jgi:hypothetical protein
MSTRFIKQRRIVLVVALLFSLGACGIFPETIHQLAPESRLPRWYVLPKGVERKDVSLEMRYYAPPGKPKLMFLLKYSNGKRISTMTGIVVVQGMNSEGKEKKPHEHPSYRVVKVNGVVDVIEHRKAGDIFYLCDDPLVWKALGIPYPETGFRQN